MEYKRICPKCGKEITYQSYSAWYNANKAGTFCRSCSYKQSTHRCGDLTKLLEDTYESYYWIGFLLADGCFSNGRLRIDLAIKDKEHLLKLASFLSYTGTIMETDKKIGLAIKDIDTVEAICNKFNILKQKTYNPPSNLHTFQKDYLYCILAGFIDGDGSIQNQSGREDFFLRIKNHSSWLEVLRLFSSLISQKETVKINSKGYAELIVTNTKYLQQLKSKILYYNLPILSRKWDVIDMNFISKYTKAEEIRIKVIDLLKQKVKQVDIARQLGISQASVTQIKKKYYEYNN